MSTKRKPDLLEAAANNPLLFRQMMAQSHLGSSMRSAPLNAQTQKEIEEAIKAQNIAENMASALEYHPEGFGTVCMLYIPCRVNGIEIKAFVDCGAQATISAPCLSCLFNFIVMTSDRCLC